MATATRRFSITSILFLTLLAIATVNSIQASTWQLFPDGSGDAETIQAAIDSAVPGDTVLLNSGTYLWAGNTGVYFRGKAITVRSAMGPELTEIDCRDVSSGIVFNGKETAQSVLEGITIRGGNGSGISVMASSPTIRDCKVLDCFGGGIYIDSSSASPDFFDCEVKNNQSSSDGGGVLVRDGAKPRFVRCLIRDNTADRSGGGLYSEDNNDSIYLDSCTLVNNSAQDNGGGVFSRGFITMTDCLVDSNFADVGGGVYTQNAGAVLAECIFNENAANTRGGGVYASVTLTLTECIFLGNSANTQGGGLYFSSGSPSTIVGCTFAGNSGADGAGLYCQSASSLEVSQCTFNANVGDAILVSGGSPSIHNCILANSTIGYGIKTLGSAVPPITCCDVFGNATGNYGGTAPVLTGIRGNISADPLFCDPVAGDFTLDAASPCLNPGFACGLMGAYPQGCSGVIGVNEGFPSLASFSIYPNPFNGVLRMSGIESHAPGARLEVFDIRGRLVRSIELSSSMSSVEWDGRDGSGKDAPSGKYFIRLNGLERKSVQQAILTR